jgi:hypothetical protein
MHNLIQSFKAVDDTSALPPGPIAGVGALAALGITHFADLAVSHVRSLFAVASMIIPYKQSIHPQAKPNA